MKRQDATRSDKKRQGSGAGKFTALFCPNHGNSITPKLTLISSEQKSHFLPSALQQRLYLRTLFGIASSPKCAHGFIGGSNPPLRPAGIIINALHCSFGTSAQTTSASSSTSSNCAYWYLRKSCDGDKSFWITCVEQSSLVHPFMLSCFHAFSSLASFTIINADGSMANHCTADSARNPSCLSPVEMNAFIS